MVIAEETGQFVLVNLTLVFKAGMGKRKRKKGQKSLLTDSWMQIMSISFLFCITQGKLLNVSELINM